MPVLNEGQRRSLEKAVLVARDMAEAGARAAIQQLSVHAGDPFSHLSGEERTLRNRLRARARQLGDTRNAKSGAHGIEHLVVECAYEHWHRMLFARFLAENHVLMHPDGVPVSLEECEELAPNEGAADGWELAARYAERMLPQIFRPGSPIFELKLPPEKVRQLERLLADLPSDVFTASDSLGWVYQFWQAKKKEDVNKSEVKIGADELPAVTQLFTEPYMVQFLLHNTLGAWWVGRHGRDSLPLGMPYLRFLEDGTPAAGTFDGWPESTAELKVLDPCCGSGHFLVAAFEILVRFRMAEESLSVADACSAVLRDNLHGLEIDERCTQIAAFALALAAWTFPDAGGYRALPQMHIACSGLAPGAKKSEWLALAGDDERLRRGMESLYDLFQDAPVLGSLIDPTAVGFAGEQRELGIARFEELRPLLDAELESASAKGDVDRSELGVAAKGIVAAAELLACRHHLVVTNVPYVTLRKQAGVLSAFCKEHYRAFQQNLGAVFIARMLRSCTETGVCAVVAPQDWLFLDVYEDMRRALLPSTTWLSAVRLGPKGFRTPMWDMNVMLFVCSRVMPNSDSAFATLDVSTLGGPHEKSKALQQSVPRLVVQERQLSNPDARVIFEESADAELLSEHAIALMGVSTGDGVRFNRFFWEVGELGETWEYLQSTVGDTQEYGGRSQIIRWEGGQGQIYDLAQSVRHLNHSAQNWARGRPSWGKRGVVISQMGDLPATLYLGDIYDCNCCAIVPKDEGDLAALWAFCQSDDFRTRVRAINQALKVPPHTLLKIPFEREQWTRVGQTQNDLPIPSSLDSTQWLFQGGIAESNTPLQVAVARLVGYRWPEQTDDGIEDLIDDDGIVCLPAVRGEQPATVRLQAILARSFHANRQVALLAEVGCKGWTVERWLREKFFGQHCKLFQNRPFIWHIWDGLKKGGFGALVNYHKLDRKLLETLSYNYVGDWIRRQEDGVKRGEDGADDRLQAARALQDKLKCILEGEPPCDIFVRWKPIERQPIGWHPDINDGVRLNIRPFMLVGDVGKKGAGILRDKPNIKWGKDRGKDPSDAPWYDAFGGDRINDHHLTPAQKQAARNAAGGG